MNSHLLLKYLINNSNDMNYSSNGDSDEENQNDDMFTEEQRLAFDIRDYNLLMMLAQAEIIELLGYVLEVISTLQALQVISNKYIPNNENIEDPDPDSTALLSAMLLLYGQTFVTPITQINYLNYAEHFSTNDINAGRSATYEIFVGEVIEEIAYVFNYLGAQQLFNISKSSEDDS